MEQASIANTSTLCPSCGKLSDGKLCTFCGHELKSEATLTCPACNTPGNGYLCSVCGERLQPKRITVSRLIHDIPDVFDLDYGLLYTIRTFMTRPGKEIREYFAGNRVRHYKPIKFVLFMGGLLTFLLVSSDISDGTIEYKNDDSNNLSAALMLLQFPLIALVTWLFFRSNKYNYGEHLVANAFIIGEVIIFRIILVPFLLLVNGTSTVGIIEFLYPLFILCYYTYVYYDWFYPVKTAPGFFKCLGIVFFLILFIASLENLLLNLINLI